MKNWSEYIDQKFLPKDEFVFTTEEVSNSLTISHQPTKTSICFIWPSSDWQKLTDIHFYNPATKGWSGEYNDDLTFNTGSVKKVNEFLHPAFETGWSSKDYYLFGKHFKSVVAWDLEFKGSKFRYYSSELGFLSFLILPFFELLSLIKGPEKLIKVKPIKPMK